MQTIFSIMLSLTRFPDATNVGIDTKGIVVTGLETGI
jgi:hypothetical protein